MALNSVNTNMGAMVALQSLNRTTDALDTTQKRISTGFRVADAKDDGAAFAVAQGVRADIAGLSSANEQIGGVKGLVSTALSSLTSVSNAMTEINKTLGKLADQSISAEMRTSYEEQFVQQVKEVDTRILDSTYNGRSLLTTAAQTADQGDVTVIRNENGGTLSIGSITADDLTFSTAADPATAITAPTQAEALAMLDGTGGAKTFDGVKEAISSAMNQLGNDSRYLDNQISYNKEKMDSMESGLGALIDADLAKESAKLQSLQIRQQLGTQALGIANQAPQTLLSLFR